MSGSPTAAGSSWFDAFPLNVAAKAATAICKSWRVLAAKESHFHKQMKEPALTKALKVHVEQVTAREVGLLGMWAAETIIGVIDPATGQMTQERRTDITFGWNDSNMAMQLVFEFKKLTSKANSHAVYVGASGMGRFVDGIYSQGQPVAAMVGMMSIGAARSFCSLPFMWLGDEKYQRSGWKPSRQQTISALLDAPARLKISRRAPRRGA